MSNKYAGTCAGCGEQVGVGAGYVVKTWARRGQGARWKVYCPACAPAGAVMTITIPGAGTFTRNIRGRCEDAPCCGCCTI